ncbi:YdcF family protein [Candidatus Falkowbacteria bacterium]|nr:YdcF family protein [Candidatus Falkowbacteria bacterium]
MPQSVDNLAKKIWNYHLLNHKLKKADCILTLGSHDLRVAERAAQLFFDGLAPFIVFAGNRGRFTSDWKDTEAYLFSLVALKMGVPKEKILIEDKSTNTGENILFTKKLLQEKNFNPQKFIVVTKPFMERRAFATFKKQWFGKNVIVTSPKISFDKYPTKEYPKERLINSIVADFQRIKIYPAKGFQIPQDIPPDVWSAYEQLVKLGYNKHLIK